MAKHTYIDPFGEEFVFDSGELVPASTPAPAPVEKYPAVQSKAGLIGFLQGSIKSLVHNYEYLAQKSPTPHLAMLVRDLKELLEESEELWERAKHC